MKFIKIISIFFLFTAFTSCGGKGKTSDSPANTKSIFSLWTHPSNLELDYSAGRSFGTSFSSLFTDSQGTCRCTTTINGNQLKGTITNTACTYQSTGLGDCTELVTTYNYSISGAILEFYIDFGQFIPFK